MATVDSSPDPVGIADDAATQRALFEALISFLTVSVHHILFLRGIYPTNSFASTTAYNYPVRQNRHPHVCAWITDAIAAVKHQLEENLVKKVALCIFECQANRVLERWTFDLQSIPIVPKEEDDEEEEESPTGEEESPTDEEEEWDSEEVEEEKIDLTDVEASFRATLARISTSAMQLRGLPDGPEAPECSFTIVIEVQDRGERPVGRLAELERRWVAAEPASRAAPSPHDRNRPRGKHSSPSTNRRTYPVRRLDAREIQLEVWVEEAAIKFSLPTSQPTLEQKKAMMSYEANEVNFDPEEGFKPERRNILRNTGDGIGTDYQRY